MSLGRRMTRTGNRIGVWMYRTLDGRLRQRPQGGDGPDAHDARSTDADPPVHLRALPRHPGGPGRLGHRSRLAARPGLVPQPARGVRRSPCRCVPSGSRRGARELVGDERDAVWQDVVLARAPEVVKYARKAGRTIPVAVLRRVDEPPPG